MICTDKHLFNNLKIDIINFKYVLLFHLHIYKILQES